MCTKIKVGGRIKLNKKGGVFVGVKAKPGRLNNLRELLNRKEEFEITEYEYTNITGGTFSKNISYLKNSSALSKFAKDNGYYIEVIPAQIIPMKVYFKLKKAKH